MPSLPYSPNVFLEQGSITPSGLPLRYLFSPSDR